MTLYCSPFRHSGNYVLQMCHHAASFGETTQNPSKSIQNSDVHLVSTEDSFKLLQGQPASVNIPTDISNIYYNVIDAFTENSSTKKKVTLVTKFLYLKILNHCKLAETNQSSLNSMHLTKHFLWAIMLQRNGGPPREYQKSFFFQNIEFPFLTVHFGSVCLSVCLSVQIKSSMKLTFRNEVGLSCFVLIGC